LETDKSALLDQTEKLSDERVALQLQSEAQQQKISTLGQQEQMLSSQLTQITEQFSALQLDTESQVTTLEQTNLSLSDQIDDLTLKLAQLNIELQKRRAQETGLLTQLAEKQKEYDALQSSEQLVQQQFTDASAEIEALAERIRKRERENQLLQSQATEQGQLFISLQDEYNSLEEKYRGLIRAARSSAGKEVAAVYFLRSATGYEYRLQEPGSLAPQSVTKGELDNRLGRLKARLGRNLYTRVIIPEDSNLSHNEAWRFTQEILNNYDYYYQPPE
jgi:chromosome segregation ATPase